MILQSTRKLKDYTARVFIGPDDPIEVRRKKTFDRLKYKAGREGKQISVDNGVLIIDGVPTYALNSGFINSQNNGPQS